MKEIFKNLMDLDQPVLTKILAPKIAPYAKLIYLIILLILALATLGSIGLLLLGNVVAFAGAIFWIVVQFAIVRMFCEYLSSAHPDKK